MKKIFAFTSLLFLLMVAVLPQQAAKAASVYSATITISGKEYKINSIDNKLEINLDNLVSQNHLSETDKVEKIIIETPAGAQTVSAGLFTSEEVSVVDNKAEFVVADLLGSLDRQQDGVAISTVREFLFPVNNQIMGSVEVVYEDDVEDLTLVLKADKQLNLSTGTPVNVDSLTLTANGKVLKATKTGTNKFSVNLAGFDILDNLEAVRLTSNTATTVSVFSRTSAFYSDLSDVKFADHVATLDRAKVVNWAANLGVTVPDEVNIPVFMVDGLLADSGIRTLNGVVADDNGNQSPFSVTIQNYGWVQIDNVWYYINADGEKVTGWNKIGGKWYFFNQDGAMQTGWVKDAGKWYFLNLETGVMQTGLVKDNGKLYVLDQNGAWVTGNGWVKAGNKWYYLVNSTAKTGWVKSVNQWYYLDTNTAAMVTGWAQVNGKWYFMNADGKMVTGWTKLNGKWYFMSANGEMVTGWLKQSKNWYYLKTNGEMAIGWVQVAGKWYYLYSDGRMAANTIIGGKYKIGKDGVWIK